MKTYMTENQIRLVGRVWEIRHYLKMAQQRLTTDVRLLQFLSEQTGHNHQQQPSRGLWLDGSSSHVNTPEEMNTPPAEAVSTLHDKEPAKHSRLHPLQPQFQPSSTDPRVIPFPLNKWAQDTLQELDSTPQP